MTAGMVHALGADGSIALAPSADVVWVFRRRRRQWLEDWRRGEGATEFFYGLLSLRERYRVGFVEEERANPFTRPWYPLERVVARRVEIGFALDLALRHLRSLNRSRVIVSTVDACGLPLAFLKRLGLLRTPLIYISQGLTDRVAAYGADRWLPRRYKRLVLAAEQLVTLSAGAAASLAAWLEIPLERVHVLPFGIDGEFWRNTASPDEGGRYMFSIGSDAGRDYATLLAAAGTLPLHIVTAMPLPLDARSTVATTTTHTSLELRDLYSRARFVVIPLHDRSQPSGQSAALQAMACGKAVVLTRTRGWWGGNHLRDGENCVIVPPADPVALRSALLRLWAEPETCARIGARARATVMEHFAEPGMAAALSELIATGL